jgi:hypothetical protein
MVGTMVRKVFGKSLGEVTKPLQRPKTRLGCERFEDRVNPAGWLDDYSAWWDRNIGGAWYDNTLGAATNWAANQVFSTETLANASDTQLALGTAGVVVVAVVGAEVGTVAVTGTSIGGVITGAGGAALVTGEGMANAAIMRAFFTGQQLAQNPVTVAALVWYRQVANDALARYQAMGYTGPGVATQTARLQQIAQQLQAWGVE